VSPSSDSTIGQAVGTARPVQEPEHAVPGPGPVRLVTRFPAVDDSAAARLLDELRATTVSVEAEPGHLTYDVFADQDDPRSLYVIETWADASDAKRHEDLVLGNGTAERVAPLLTGPLRTLTLRPVATDGARHQPAPLTGRAGSNDKEAERK
jgi:quinol monooxygenase YgiN